MARQRSSGRRTDYVWSSFGDQELTQDLSTSTAFFGTVISNGVAENEAVTLMRLRGRVGAQLDSAAIDESTMLLCGIMIVNRDLFVAAGVTGAPELLPILGVDEASWIWQGSIWLTSGSQALIDWSGQSGSVEIDSKAMRRMKTNAEGLAIVFQMPAALTRDAAGTIDITWMVHFLVGK